MNGTVVTVIVILAVFLCAAFLYGYCSRTKRTGQNARTESPRPVDGESLQAVSHTAKLHSFFWRQSGPDANECFTFSFKTARGETEHAEFFLSCEYRTPDGGCAECDDFPVSRERWSELENRLKNLSLPPYSPPSGFIADAVDSCIETEWADNGVFVVKKFNGEYAHELRLSVKELAGRIISENGAGVQ